MLPDTGKSSALSSAPLEYPWNVLIPLDFANFFMSANDIGWSNVSTLLRPLILKQTDSVVLNSDITFPSLLFVRLVIRLVQFFLN